MELSFKRFALGITASMILAMGALFSFYTPAVNAQAENLCNGANLTLSGNGDCDEADAETSINGALETVINVLSTIVGVVAVIFIILGGFKYVSSGGDSGKVASAKSTIIYALVGLLFVALAQIIVKFVISKAS